MTLTTTTNTILAYEEGEEEVGPRLIFQEKEI